MRRYRILVIAFALWGASVVNAEATCWVSNSGVVFGSYNVFDTTPLVTTGDLGVMCDHNEKNIRVTLDNGNSNTFSRYLRNGTNQLNYNLYMDATYSTIWGDGTNGTSQYQNSRPPKNQVVNLKVYARIPAGQDVTVGTYSDNVLMTVLF